MEDSSSSPIDESGNEGLGLNEGSTICSFSDRDTPGTTDKKGGRNYTAHAQSESSSNGDSAYESSS